MPIGQDERWNQNLVVLRENGDTTTDERWDGRVKILIYNPDTLDWEAATGGGATGEIVEVSNFPANPATSTLQTTGNSTLSSILSELQTPMAVKLDDSADPVLYLGIAAIGSGAASAVWRIMKIDTTSGVVITWADGNSNYDNVWNNRASLSYS